ncbi:hypothetical protein ASPBRDRAFT_622125 [Aspergillus brasiliensis CBS 101740]|uniref:Uncharacterized protein n=1 Tax=Aspergillus brasiliensis (strain CBS 101740 / IMI 381727 / IBT 21946) TaxID=767769 RepID=A0A1L9UFP8_ASPBC|nr:hypothetical protein ASPBRDRAFT_622125 [Aspergillus brasiliensis CBS 101740]
MEGKGRVKEVRCGRKDRVMLIGCRMMNGQKVWEGEAVVGVVSLFFFTLLLFLFPFFYFSPLGVNGEPGVTDPRSSERPDKPGEDERKPFYYGGGSQQGLYFHPQRSFSQAINPWKFSTKSTGLQQCSCSQTGPFRPTVGSLPPLGSAALRRALNSGLS